MRTATKFNKTLKLIFLFTLGMSISWASAITVQLRDSEGNTLPDGNTATLEYWNAGWVTLATNDGFGNFVVPTSMLPATVKMNYNFSSEQRQFAVSEVSPVIFNTVSFTAVVKDANDVLLTMPTGYYSHRQTTWGANVDAGVFQEILPGIHVIHMEFHTSEQQHTEVLVSLANDPQTEVFNTVTITPKLEDCLGNEIDVANNPDWEFRHGHTGPCPGCDLNNGMELLPGGQAAFWLRYKGIEINRIGNYPPSSTANTPYMIPNVPSDVVFTAPSILETFVWEDMNQDGYQTNEELFGVSGVTVDIVKPNGTLLMSTTTNNSGRAIFFDYPVDQPIKIHCQPMNGYSFTKSKGSKTNQNNSDVDKNGFSPAFQAGSCGEFLSYIDAGMVINTSNKADFAAMNSNVLYPNPAKEAMSYSYKLDQDSQIHMSIYNTTGAQVMLIEDGMRASGTNVSEWDVSSLAPGMYIFRALLGDEVITERFVKTK